MTRSSTQPSSGQRLGFAVLSILFFLLSVLFSAITYFLWTVVFDTPSGLLDLFIVAILCFGLGIFLTSRFFWNVAFEKFSFNIDDVLIPIQMKRGYLLALLTYALVSGLYIVTPLSRNYNEFFYIPFIVTYCTTLIKALITKRADGELSNRFSSQPIQYKGLVMPTGDFEPQCKETMHGSAAWITDQKKNELTTLNADGTPSFEGLWLGGGYFDDEFGNLISIAPPGSGKGTNLIIPNLLWIRLYLHSFVVFDPKGTNACITARFRQEQGHKVYIIDPLGLQKLNNATHGIPSSCFNPLDHVKDDIFNGTAQIANLLIPDEPGSKDKYWNMDARNLVHLLLMHILTCDTFEGYRDLTSLHQIIISGKVTAVIKEAMESIALDGLISDTASGFDYMIAYSPKTFSSVVSVASASIKWLSNPALQKALQSSDFSPNDLAEGNVTLYICQPIANKEGFATFSRLITGFCLRANSMPAGKPKAWVYYLLDEFPTMGVFPEVKDALAFSREYRMRIWLFAQSLSQIDNTYTLDTRDAMLGNITTFQSFNATDYVTQEYVSKKAGNQTVSYITRNTQKNSGSSYSNNSGSSGGSSHGNNSGESFGQTEVFSGKPLISPDEVAKDGYIITFTARGSMRLYKFPYYSKMSFKGFESYNEKFLDGRADPNPNF